ncbi:MAG TPA: KEOPS complex subunit Pcc1 [Candidatus Saccharimonadales bacterium]|nr:KEOPS complex subunit Pcc1 [Candidatus Saccharimonadales bacterium]
MHYKRSKVMISRKGEEISAVIEADDSRALLASAQSLLKQIRVVNGVDKMIDELTEKA